MTSLPIDVNMLGTLHGDVPCFLGVLFPGGQLAGGQGIPGEIWGFPTPQREPGNPSLHQFATSDIVDCLYSYC